MPKENIMTLSRSTNANADYTETPDAKEFPKLYEAISAGCLQRIADSLEKMEDPFAKLHAEKQELTRTLNKIRVEKNDQVERLEGIVRTSSDRANYWERRCSRIEKLLKANGIKVPGQGKYNG